MLGVTATVEVYPERIDEFLAVFSELAKAVELNEPANHLYVLGRIRDAANRFVVMELYENDAAIEFHRQSPHFREFAPKLGEMQSVPIQVTYSDICV